MVSTPARSVRGTRRRIASIAADARLLIPVIGLLLVSGVWGSLLIYERLERAAIERSAVSSARELTDTYAAYVIRALREIDQTLNLIVHLERTTGRAPSLDSLKSAGLLPPGMFFTVAVADENGRITDATGPLSSNDISRESYFLKPGAATGVYISHPHRSARGEWALFFSVRRTDAGGNFAGVVVLSVDASYFVSSYDRSALGDHGVLALIAPDGVQLVRRTGASIQAGARVNSTWDGLHPRSTGNGALERSPADGVQRYTGRHALTPYPVVVLVGLSRDETLQALTTRLAIYKTIGLACTAAIVLMTVLLWTMSVRLERSRRREHTAQIVIAEQAREQLRERQLLEAQLLLNQKMEAIGQLAAGIAHEINTPIQFVCDSIEFLHSALEELSHVRAEYLDGLELACAGKSRAEVLRAIRAAEERADVMFLLEEAPRALARATEGITRIAKIVRAMREFTYQNSEEFSPADINRAIETTVEVARSEYKHIAVIELDLAPLPQVTCCLSQVNQALLNIMINAAHAIGESGKDVSTGVIRIASRSSGEWVQICVSDNGCGIPEEIARRIYEPFFTTKEVGRGTGQGLAIAHRVVVKNHSGKLSFRSQIGEGTTFVIELPVRPRSLETGVLANREAA